MRKQGKRRSVNYGLKPKAPVLVMRGINETALELRERLAVEAFAMGGATQEHFMLIQDVLNLLLIAGQSSHNRRYALEKAEREYKHVVACIQQRWERTNKWGMTGEELNAMREMIAFSRTFWMRQPAELLVVCQRELVAFYRQQEKARQAA
jgi:hypothetical protein